MSEPEHPSILKQWLKSGFIDIKGTLFPANSVTPTEEGIPQGGPISPTISNIILNGIQTVAEKAVAGNFIYPGPSVIPTIASLSQYKISMA